MRSVFLVCIAIFPLLVCSGIVYTVLSLYMAELGATKSQIGLLYTFGALAGAITSPLLGKLGDKWGRKPLLLASMTLFSAVFADLPWQETQRTCSLSCCSRDRHGGAWEPQPMH